MRSSDFPEFRSAQKLLAKSTSETMKDDLFQSIQHGCVKMQDTIQHEGIFLFKDKNVGYVQF